MKKSSEVYCVWEVHRILRNFAWQFCMAVLQDIVYYFTSLKTSEVWRAAFFSTFQLLILAC